LKRSVEEPTVEKKKGTLDKLKTSIGDTISDIMTANKMAADKFSGDTALMQMAREYCRGLGRKG